MAPRKSKPNSESNESNKDVSLKIVATKKLASTKKTTTAKKPSAAKKSTAVKKTVAKNNNVKQPAVNTPTLNDVSQNAIVSLAVEAFRFDATYNKMIECMDEVNQKKYKNKYPYFKKKITAVIDEAGLEVIDLTNQKYDPGMAVTVMNASDFIEGDNLYIEQMIDPIIMNKDGVVSLGTILLRRNEK